MPATSTDRKLEITLLQERAAGTFARVYMARARAPDGLTRIVAVKVLREKWSDTKEVLTRTRDEAQLLARLQHPNILRVEAITQVDGQPAIVMEFVHGADLGQILEKLGQINGHFPFRTIYEIAERVMGALAAAYFKVPVGVREPLRVVHRDLKPSNIMISAEGALKVLDFGTARFDDAERMARTEAIRFGSLKYMSSERREGDRGDHSSDIFSVGLLLLELIHGRPLPTLPLEREPHDQEIARRIGQIADFGLPNEGWDISIRETIERMLCYSAVERLDAQQCKKLFRAFKEQASGDALSAFAEQVVGPMAGNIFAAPDDGEMSGARFELQASAVDIPSLDPEPPTDTGPPALDTQDMPEIKRVQPSGLRDSSGEVQKVVPQPGYAFGNLDIAKVEALPKHDVPTDTEDPKTITDETTTAFQVPSTVMAPPRPEGPSPAQLHTKPPAPVKPVVLYGAIGCAAVSVLLGMGLVTLWINMQRSNAPAELIPANTSPASTQQATDPAEDPPATPPGFTVTLMAGDPTVQWLRLFNADGRQVLNAKPDGTAKLAEGQYTIRVKVVARDILKGTISISQDTTLRCKPANMANVRCVDANEKTRVVLKP